MLCLSRYIVDSGNFMGMVKSNFIKIYIAMLFLVPSVCSAEVEFLSCNDSQSGSGLSADTSYTPDVPIRSSEGSDIPAVEITSSTATTTTRYIMSFINEPTDEDIIIFEYKAPTSGWCNIAVGSPAAISSLIMNNVLAGAYIVISGSSVTVNFSNAGRKPGSTYGAAVNSWSALQTLGYKWRIRKVTPSVSEGQSYIDCDQIPVNGINPFIAGSGFYSDWTGQYYEDFEDAVAASTIDILGSEVIITKADFQKMSGQFSIVMTGIILFSWFKAIV